MIFAHSYVAICGSLGHVEVSEYAMKTREANEKRMRDAGKAHKIKAKAGNYFILIFLF